MLPSDRPRFARSSVSRFAHAASGTGLRQPRLRRWLGACAPRPGGRLPQSAFGLIALTAGACLPPELRHWRSPRANGSEWRCGGGQAVLTPVMSSALRHGLFRSASDAFRTCRRSASQTSPQPV